jgi:hypothetical protein
MSLASPARMTPPGPPPILLHRLRQIGTSELRNARIIDRPEGLGAGERDEL